MRRNLWLVIGGLAVSPVLSWLVGVGLGAPRGWAVLLGLVLPLVFFGITVVTALATATASVGRLGATVLVSWLAKIAVLLAALYWLRGQDFYDRPVFFGVFLIATTAVLLAEAVVVKRARVPYVDV